MRGVGTVIEDKDMNKDRRHPTLTALGVRTWRGAAMFGLQALAIFLPAVITVKIIGDMLMIAAIVEKSWVEVLIAAVAPAIGIFVWLTVITWVQDAAGN